MGRKRVGNQSSDKILRHIEAAGKRYSVEELVEHLRSTHPLYSRHKLRPFTKLVERLIRRNDTIDAPITKRRKKVEDDGQKHRNGDVSNNDGGGSSLATASSAVGESSSDEKTSTSDDGEELDPEFDLTKSLMRDNLQRKSRKEALELEVEDSKSMKDVKLLNDEAKSVGNSTLNKNDRIDSSSNNGIMFKDLAGMSRVIEELEVKIMFQFCHPQLKLEPMSGILLHGPPGCGKTTLAHAMANELGVPFYKILVSGESEENIRELFSKAYRTAPSIVFIDEIDSIGAKRDDLHTEKGKRIVTQLMTCMDELHRPTDCRPGNVLVIGATNRPDSLDYALRRAGRFDLEIELGLPDEAARVEILSTLTSNLKVEGDFDLLKIAKSTPGFVATDLKSLVKLAHIPGIRRIRDKRRIEMSKEDRKDWWRQPCTDEEVDSITMADFEEAAKSAQPVLKREGFSPIPDVKWDDIGGLDLLKEEFNSDIIGQIRSPEIYEEFGLAKEAGILLFGPPGCGKTLIAQAVANAAGFNFMSIKGAEILNKYVGESESQLRKIFSRARSCSPCIIFFDEVDALTAKRDTESGVVERVLSQLLTELDGAQQRRGVYVIGATNRPEVIDPALCRPGRFGKTIYVGLPSPDERVMILKALARKKPIDANVDIVALGNNIRCDNMSGADLKNLMEEAAKAAVNERLSSPNNSLKTIKEAHFMKAFEKVSRSVSDEEIHRYKLLAERFKCRRG